MSSQLLIRADADTAMGTGHVMRCLALAAQWPGNVTFAGVVESHVRERIVRAGHRFAPIPAAHPNPADLQSTLSLAEELSAAWIVLDGYHFDPDYHRAVRDAGYRLLVIDDNAHQPHYHADLLLNQNIYASELSYQVDDQTILLLGTRYALLRPEFVERGPSPLHEDAHHVLLTLGGGDPDNVTLTALDGIRLLEDPGLRVRVVVGMANLNQESLVTLAESDGRIELLENVQDMPGLMAWADAAISAGGSTNWELCYMGVPNVIIILADNQEPIAQGLAAAGASVNLGWHTAVTPRQIADVLSRLLGSADRRRAIRQHQRELVDGLGAGRISDRLRRAILGLRPARTDDMQLLWEWANDPVVREASFNLAPIPWDEHKKWFERKLNAEGTHIFIGENAAGRAIGQIRFDARADGDPEIDVSIESGQRGQGYGALLIDAATREMFSRSSSRTVHAFVKPDNVGSYQAFVKAKFEDIEHTLAHGHQLIHFIRKKHPHETIRREQQTPLGGLEMERAADSPQRLRILYMGNNRIGWQVLDWLTQQGADIIGLVIHPPAKRKFVDEMLDLVDLPADNVFNGSRLREASVREAIADLKPDIGLSILFDYILKPDFISLFPLGVVNLHPSYLPYNRGQYPNVWSIVERTPAGVTIHYIDAGIDTGDLIAQRKVPVASVDTGQTLYHRLERTSFDLFKETWPLIAARKAPRIKQTGGQGTYHRAKDVEQIDRIDLKAHYTARELIDILRARTFPPHSGAYFIDDDGRRVDVRIELRYAEDEHGE